MCKFLTEAIPIPADQPIMKISDLDEVAIPTVEIKVSSLSNVHVGHCLELQGFSSEKTVVSFMTVCQY